MCWIFSSGKEGADILEDQFRNAYDKNNDGAGFMYAKNGELFIEKGFFNFDEFYRAYSEIDKKYSRVVHFRASTGGGKTSINCHPFSINKDLGFAHNGTFSGFLSTAEHSDTYLFNEEVLKPLFSEDYKELYKGHIKWMLQESIMTNKIVFLDKDGDSLILNASLGEWDKIKKGAWYSGIGHLYPQVYYPRSTPYNGSPYLQQSVNKFSSEVNVIKFEGESYDEWINRHYKIYLESLSKKKKEEQLVLMGEASN